MTGSLPRIEIAASVRPGSHPASGTGALAHAFDRALHDTGCVDDGLQADSRMNPSPDGVSELAGAVRDFVAAGRADESPPERILATIKRVTRPCIFDGADEVRGDRLQALIMSEFLASYYDVAPAAVPDPTAHE